MNYSKQSVYINCTIIAEKIGRVLDKKYLQSEDCSETELRQLQDILIEDYNRKLAK